MRTDADQVTRADARREQRLVGVAVGRLGDGERGLGPQVLCEAGGTELSQQVAVALRRRREQVDLGQLAAGRDRERLLAVRPVDRHIGEPVQQLRRPVARRVARQQFGALVDEGRGDVARDEGRILQHGAQEGDVGRYPADAELGQRPARSRDRGGEVAATARELGQHRVEVRADLGARGRRAAVEADARAAGRAVGRDAPRVGPEALRRVFGRDARLQREAAHADVLLPKAEVGEGLARRDTHLRLHEVDIRHLLRDRVLDLDARVHLDEDDLAGAGTCGLEQELDGAGVLVPDRAGEGDGVRVQPGRHLGVEVRRWGDLDDLLVSTLHGAVALEEVNGLARGIRQDLHLDVPRPDDGLLEEHAAVAERGLRLARRGGDRLGQFRGVFDAAHAAAAAAGDRLDEDREADLVRLCDERVDVIGCRGRAQHRNACRDRVLLGGDLVAGHLEGTGRRADEGDAVLGGAGGELRILGEEPIARVDGIRPRGDRDADDLVDIEVRAHRMPLLADLVGLVGLLAVERAAILPGEDGDGAGTELVRRTERADRDFAAVRDQDLSEHAHLAWM